MADQVTFLNFGFREADYPPMPRQHRWPSKRLVAFRPWPPVGTVENRRVIMSVDP
jgi:hypothetical protein